jgi:AAA family ATP:ADP antiporter
MMNSMHPARSTYRSLRASLPGSGTERIVALWAFAYFFMLLAGYYVLRPLRDQMGIAGGVKALPWMFMATFLTLLLAQPLYGLLLKKLSRRRFVVVCYQFFAANLLLFWLLLTLGISTVTVARVFFVWVSVFNLFAVAVFWSQMADLFTSEQGKRLFGFIGAGGTAGSLLGPAITVGISVPLGATNLLLVAVVFLELALLCVSRLERAVGTAQGTRRAAQPVGGGIFSGFGALLRSRYLLGTALWVSLMSFGATILYLEQAHVISAHVHGAGEQTRLFAGMDLTVGILSLVTQLLATGRVLKRFGTGVAAAALPAVYLLGFAVLAVAPALAVVFVFQVAQRWMNFAVANPARQVLFTVVARDEKYKAKNMIDVVVFRGSDALYASMFDGLQALGLKITVIATCALPIALGWLLLSTRLGRAQERRAAVLSAAVAQTE